MHEIGVAKEILNIVIDKAEGRKVTAISVQLGDDGHTTPESLTHAFAMVSQGTIASGAKLSIAKVDTIESRVVDFDVDN
jgi:hydrogenase nickel incorporation protein HypA/HybF